MYVPRRCASFPWPKACASLYALFIRKVPYPSSMTWKETQPTKDYYEYVPGMPAFFCWPRACASLHGIAYGRYLILRRLFKRKHSPSANRFKFGFGFEIGFGSGFWLALGFGSDETKTGGSVGFRFGSGFGCESIKFLKAKKFFYLNLFIFIIYPDNVS